MGIIVAFVFFIGALVSLITFVVCFYYTRSFSIAPLKGDVTKLMLFALLTSLSPAIGSLIGIEIVSSKRS